MEKPNTYIRLYFSNLQQLEMLSFEQVGRLVVGIMQNKYYDAPLDFQGDSVLEIVAQGVLGRINEDYASYDRTCAQNRVNGAKGGAPKGNQNARKKTTETTERLKTTLNNKEINKENKKDIYIVEQDSTTHISEIKEIVDYLNTKAGTSYRHTTKNTQKHIKARLKENYTVADFKRVIDSRVKVWGSDKDMQQYLRPDTLFGAKFESYLQNVDISATDNDIYRGYDEL